MSYCPILEFPSIGNITSAQSSAVLYLPHRFLFFYSDIIPPSCKINLTHFFVIQFSSTLILLESCSPNAAPTHPLQEVFLQPFLSVLSPYTHCILLLLLLLPRWMHFFLCSDFSCDRLLIFVPAVTLILPLLLVCP